MAAKSAVTGGTPEAPWTLKTAPGTAEYQAWRDPALDPPALVVQVDSFKALQQDLWERCVEAPVVTDLFPVDGYGLPGPDRAG